MAGKGFAPKDIKAYAVAEGDRYEHETPDLREWKQRLKFYKKRLGSHQQKALKYERKGEEVPKRTLDAIANNRQWVEHFTTLISQAEGRKA